MAPKRKAPHDPSDSPAAKKLDSSDLKPSTNGTSTTTTATTSASFLQPDFYPSEMPASRCAKYIDGTIPRPITLLNRALEKTATARSKIPVGDAVVHWYKRDLRTHDNRGLAAAAAKAAEGGVPLICVFIVSGQDYQAHFTSPMRVDLDLRLCEILRRDLGELDVPMYVEAVEDRKKMPGRLLELCKGWGAKHLFCNMEYEVDELRREKKLVETGLEQGVSVDVLHDDVVVSPGILATGQGKQFSVYSPWFRAWCAKINAHPKLLDESPRPGKNPPSAREKFKDIFGMKFPPVPDNKRMEPAEQEKFEKLWPGGEHEALARLEKFLDGGIKKYKDTRNFPAQDTTAKLSVHFSSGALSARTAVRMAVEKSGSKKVDGGSEGVKGWISEVAWRDFYKHVMAWWPFVCMYKPFKYELSSIKWDYEEEHWQKWISGTTGFPIVDAAIRQMNSMGWMHNRCRMIVASFLAKDLLIDWRYGERYFMEHLIDGDFASNNGGWGFSASTGVDPQPYFRIFNPLLQSEKFDVEGEYIRKWVPELAEIKGKAIHDPYGRGEGKKAEKAGYPKPCVVHSERRAKALALYKSV